MYEDEESSKAPLLIGLGVFFVVALVAAYFVFARKPEVIAAPKSYTPFVASDKMFACQGPEGWKRAESVGMGGTMSGVTFTKGKAKIKIESDLGGSLMGDIAAASNAQQSQFTNVRPRPPVEKLHMSTTYGLKKELEGFQEKPMREIQSALGEARASEFTGDAGFMGGGPTHGYRITILNNDRRTSVVCRCPESSWPNLKKTFQKVVESVQPGGGG